MLTLSSLNCSYTLPFQNGSKSLIIVTKYFLIFNYQYWIMNFGHFCRLHHSIFISFEISIVDIVFDSVMEQNRILRYNGNFFSQTVYINISNIVITNSDTTSIWFKKPIQKAYQSWFSRTRSANKGNSFTSGYSKT